MKMRKSTLTIAAAALVAAFSGMAPASPNPQKPSSPEVAKQAAPKASSRSEALVSRGTITSIDNDRLVLSHKVKNGKTEELTFMLNSKTERKGDLKPGSEVSVHYRSENSQLMATAIQAMPVNTTTSAKNPAVKK